MPLKKLVHILLTLCILITSCSDPSTVQPETPTVDNIVQQADNSSIQTPLPTEITSAQATATVTENIQPTAVEKSLAESPTATPPLPTITALPATSNTTSLITPAPLAPLPITGVTDNPAPSLALDDIVQRANALAPLFQGLRNALDRSQFDLIALNRVLEFDGTAIVDFVRDEIFFEQYVGVLRGAEGTLLGRAGNALDQSLLLTTLLEDAGYESRIAQGTLTTAQATTLVDQMLQERPELLAAGDEAVLQELLNEITMLQGVSAEQRSLFDAPLIDNPYQTRTESDTQFILDALEQAGVRLGDPDAMDTLIEEARNYYWVEYRLNAFDAWEAAHPAFAEAPDLVADETFIEPPTESYHRVRFEVYVEQKIDDVLVVNPILTGVENTTANLVGRPFTYQNYPNNYNLETAHDLDALLDATGIFLPVLNGEVAGNGFDLDGRMFDLDLLALDKIGATELFQAQARQLEEAAGLIDNLGEPITDTTRPDDFFTLTAQWMEYTIIAPNGTETTQRRYVFDRIGVENREAGLAKIVESAELTELAKSLLSAYTISVISNRYAPAYVAERIAKRTIDEVEALDYVLTENEFSDLYQYVRKLRPAQDVLLATAFDEGHALAPNTLTYRSEPTIVIYEEGLIPGREALTAFERVDVINNKRRAYETMTKLALAPAAGIRAGVWETHAEHAPIRQDGELFNTMVAMRKAQAQGTPLRVLQPHESDLVASLDLSSQTLHDLQTDLQAGYTVIVPTASDEERVGWWRVNTATGETLGVSTGGYGISSVEYTTLQWFIFGILAPATFTKCVAQNGAVGCCLADATVYWAIGGLGSALIAKASQGAALLIGDALFGGLQFGPLPSFCSAFQ